MISNLAFRKGMYKTNNTMKMRRSSREIPFPSYNPEYVLYEPGTLDENGKDRNSCNHQNPGLFERVRHKIGIYTCGASGAENASTPSEAAMIRKFHEVGANGFLIVRSAEAVPKQYVRNADQAR